MIIHNDRHTYHKENVVQVDVLPKNKPAPVWKVQQYYEVDSGPTFDAALQPHKYDRFVFLEQGTANYVVIPDNGYYKFSQ